MGGIGKVGASLKSLVGKGDVKGGERIQRQQLIALGIGWQKGYLKYGH
jgi:hypothetical protein